MAEDRKTGRRGQPCDVCDIVHERCLAHKVGSVEAGEPTPCGSHPRPGMDVCKAHGAAGAHVEPIVAQAKAHDVAVGEFQRLARTYGIDIRGRPHFEALAEIIAVTEHLAGKMMAKALTEDFVITNMAGDLVPHPIFEMARKWKADYEKSVRTAVELGMDERRLRVEEAQVVDIVGAVVTALRRISDEGVDPASAEAQVIVANELRKAQAKAEGVAA